MKEKKVFDRISAPQNVAEKISHLVLMKMLPALIERDIKSFGSSLTAIQELVGKSFSQYQEGSYHSKASEAIVQFLLKNGATGSGQSSWGPTVYGIVDGKKGSEELKGKVGSFMRAKGFGGHVFCTTANNKGASIRTFANFGNEKSSVRS